MCVCCGVVHAVPLAFSHHHVHYGDPCLILAQSTMGFAVDKLTLGQGFFFFLSFPVTLASPCQCHCTHAPYSFIHLFIYYWHYITFTSGCVSNLTCFLKKNGDKGILQLLINFKCIYLYFMSKAMRCWLFQLVCCGCGFTKICSLNFIRVCKK